MSNDWTTKVINTFHTIIEENYEPELNIAGKTFVTIDFNVLLNEDPDIAEYLIQDLEQALICFSIAAEKFVTGKKNVVARIINFPEDLYTPIWKLRAKNIGKLVKIKGYIRKISGVLHGVSMIKYQCDSCGNIINLPQTEHQAIRFPNRCGCGNKNKDRFKQLDKTVYDLQKVIIEEDPSLRSDTKKPQQLLAILKKDLCEHNIDKKLQPSKKIEASGIIKEKQIKPGVLEYKKYLEVHNIQVIEDSFNSIKFKREEVKEFKEMCKSATILQDLAQSIFPNIYGNQSAKEAIVLQLAGSPHLYYDDGRIDERGTLMIFLISSPGAAKSQILKCACMFAPNSIYMDCKASSAAGMVAAVVKDSEIGDFTLDIGPMGLANLSMIGGDEMDKMSKSDLAMMNTAMNDLRAIINKAQVHAIVETDTMVLGAANPKNRVFDKYLPIWKQIGLPKDFLDRFDLIFPLETIEDKDTQRHVSKIILSKYKTTNKPKTSLPIYKKETVQKFIAYIRQNHQPELIDDVSNYITEKFLELFNPPEYKYQGTLNGKRQEQTEAYFSSRLITNIVRLTRANARVKGRDTTLIEDADVGLGLLKSSLIKQQIITDKGLNTDKLEDIVPKGKRDKKRIMREIIKSLCIKDNHPTGHKLADAQETVDEAVKHFGFKDDEADEILALLKEHGEIYEPVRGKLKLI